MIQSLSQVEALVLGVGARALSDLSAAQPAAPVAVHCVISHVIAQVRIRFDRLRIEWEQGEKDLSVMVCGGELALHRILMNLMVNACEGDGQTLPTVITVSCVREKRSGRVQIRVADNGPGFTSPPRPSVKPTGSGVGLGVVRGITEASGGRMRVAPRSEGSSCSKPRPGKSQ
ncbi:MAG: hypothetical protein JW940_37945 [Polyangiaceae bacterium]|nr:hypothetical protein [Polyangiaceae bacterium]